MKTCRVVIVGGGFGGVRCARTLRRRLSRDCEIVLFNRENHMVFHPLLPEVTGASINPDAVAAPLRQILGNVHCRTEKVTHVDLRKHRVVFEQYDGQVGELPYDHVVIACGRTVNLGAVPGMADHSFALKSVGDAMAIRAHAIQQLELAEVCTSAEQRRQALAFIVVGGGFSGVEVAGELNDLVRKSRRFYPHINGAEISVTLVHSGDQILPEISPDLREFARAKMQKAGITVLLGARAAAATPDGIWLKDGRQLRGATVVCTIGTGAPLLIERMEAGKEKGALVTDADMRVAGVENAWAIGDCARIVNAVDGQTCPPTGQFAERQGRQAAENIVRSLRGEPTRPFAFKPLGQLCAIGGRSAVAEILGVRLSGFPAWFVWRAIYLFKMPSWSRRMKVGADWAWDLLFARDLVNLRIDRTERVSRAFFRRGDYVFHQGDPALSFYALEKGDVEVLRTDEGGQERLLAVLGPGDFFGEMALLEHRTRNASIRARTDIEVTMLGAEVFSHLTKSIAPLQQRIAETLRRRTTNIWARLPDAHEVLTHEPLSAFVEAVPRTLHVGSRFDEALEMFARERAEVLYVVDNDERLVGIVTVTDLLRSIDAAAAIAADERRGIPVERFMSPDPVAVTIDDSPATAAVLMWSRGFKKLPVVQTAESRRLAGCVRAEVLMMHVVSQRMDREKERAGLLS